MIPATFSCLVLLAVGVLCEVPVLPTTTAGSIGPYQDLCNQGLIQLKGVNESGQIGFSTQATQKKPTPCVVKIESCPTCQIIIEPASFDNFAFYCQTGVPRLKHQCSLGCDYLYMFDVFYLNETMRLIQAWNQTMKPFQSESSSVYIVLCHGPTNYQFTLRYRTVKKVQSIHGTTHHNSHGAIRSPFFPVGYHQNFETYEFIFSSSGKGDFIALSFDDWNLDSSSAFYFEDSNMNGPVYGSTFRPNVISNNNQMKVLFNTGQPILSSEKRGNMGFKAVYTFIADRSEFRNSKTSCKGAGYLLDSVGGQIEFTKETQPQEYYDCIWVIKTQPGFHGTYLKLMKKRLPSDERYGNKNQIQIRSGLTSEGHLISTVYNEVSPTDYQPHVDEVGFYIRINSTLSPSDSVVLSYASYKNTFISNCKHDSSLFTCNNGRCIDKKLVCDGYNHCGDNYDETHGCSYGGDDGVWDKSYQYTITIGVIVPMVISVFLIMVICLLFVMIRRCRRARLREAAGMNERLETVSEEVSTTTRRGRRRRRRRRFFGSLEPDNPPTYDEAIQSPPGWYDNVAFGTTVDPTLPQPPSYSETIQNMATPTVQTLPPGSPSSTDSSQSDRLSINNTRQSSSSSSEGGSSWEIGRRQPRSRIRTETSHVSSSDSETDDVRTPTVPTEATERRRNSSLVEGLSEVSTTPPDARDNNRKELQKADRFVHKQRNDKTDKHSNKTGPGPSNCVIPDTNNKVRSSRSMELLPTMSLTQSSIDTDSETFEPQKNNQLRSGGPMSPLNGSCPALSRNLTVFDADSASEQRNLSNAYQKSQQQDINRSRNNVSKYVTRDSEHGVHSSIPNLSNTEVVRNDASNDNNKDNRGRDESQGEGQDIMVVYDGPQVTTPSPKHSPSRTNAYLLSCSLGDQEYGTDRNMNNQSSSYRGNTSSHGDIHSPIGKQKQENHQSYENETNQNQRKQRSQQYHQTEQTEAANNTVNSHGNRAQSNSSDRAQPNLNDRSQPRPVDRRLAHLPIINQMRNREDNTRVLQSGQMDRSGGRKNVLETDSQKHSKPNYAGHDRSDRNRSEQTDRPRNERPRSEHSDQPRDDRNLGRSEQTDHYNHISGQNPSVHAGHDRNRSRPGYDGHHGNQRNISMPDENGRHSNNRHSSRPDQSQCHGTQNVGSNQRRARESVNDRHGDNDHIHSPISNSPTHRGRSTGDADRSVPGGIPGVAMATTTTHGAVNVAQDPTSEEGGGYLNLYRMGEEDDIYV